MPFVFYLSNSKATRDHNILDRTVVWVSAPVQWATVAVIDSISNTWRRYIYLVDLAEQNEELRRQNVELNAQLREGYEARLENRRLRGLMALRDSAPEAGGIVGRVVATSPTPLFRSIRVDRGKNDGVDVGDAVVDRSGVIGRVVAAGGGFSDVMLIVDPNSSLDVLVQRTRSRARVRGAGSDERFGVEVEYLARTEEVEPGDLLITSGTGSVFPKGLAVGTVVEVQRGAFGLYQHAEVEPSVDFNLIEEVLIIPSGWPKDSSFDVDDPELSKPVAAPSKEEPVAERPRAVVADGATGADPSP